MSRRRLFLAGATGAAAVAAAGGIYTRERRSAALDALNREAQTAVGRVVEPFYGEHQAGVVTAPQAAVTYASFDLRAGTAKSDVADLMRLLSDDIARLTSGRPPLADTAPQLAVTPAGVTVTIGFGSSLFDKIGAASMRPNGFAELPPFARIDALEPQYSGGDLLLQVCADDAVTVSHTVRMLDKDTRAFATPRWFQRGFRQASGNRPDGLTVRNLMGQLDGTVNPAGADQQNRLVWHPGPGWFTGGTTLVLRRIKMNLDSWDSLAPSEMEEAIGRTLDSGAPLSGGSEHDNPDFSKPDASGLPAIASFAHIRQARGDGTAPQILRRPFNFDDSPDATGAADLGLLFGAYQASVVDQYIPIQTRLAAGDLLNQWTKPVGSAVFAIPPGCQPGGWIGEGLLT